MRLYGYKFYVKHLIYVQGNWLVPRFCMVKNIRNYYRQRKIYCSQKMYCAVNVCLVYRVPFDLQFAIHTDLQLQESSHFAKQVCFMSHNFKFFALYLVVNRSYCHHCRATVSVVIVYTGVNVPDIYELFFRSNYLFHIVPFRLLIRPLIAYFHCDFTVYHHMFKWQ